MSKKILSAKVSFEPNRLASFLEEFFPSIHEGLMHDDILRIHISAFTTISGEKLRSYRFYGSGEIETTIKINVH